MQAGRSPDIPASHGQGRVVVEHEGQAGGIARGLELEDRCPDVVRCLVRLGNLEEGRAQHVVRPGDHRLVARLLEQAQRFPEADRGNVALEMEVIPVADRPDRIAGSPVVAQRPVDLERLLHQVQTLPLGIDRRRSGVSHREDVGERRVVHRIGDLGLIFGRLPALEGLAIEATHRHEVRLPPGNPAEGFHQPGPQRRVVPRPRLVRDPLEATAALDQVAALLPEPPQREAQPDRYRRLWSGCRPFERRAQIVVLHVEPIEPRSLIPTGQLAGSFLAQRKEGPSMAFPDRLGIAARRQLLG